MAPKRPELHFAGLATSVNPFSEAPELSCAILDNCVIRSRGLIEPRRGYTQSAVNPDGTIARQFPWHSRILALASTGSLRDFSDGTGWSSAYSLPASGGAGALSVFAPPDASSPQRFAGANKGLFVTTSSGVKHLDSIGGSIRDAGIPAPGISVDVTTGIGGEWFLALNSVAYRAVLCRFDANNNLIQSAPSEPTSIAAPNAASHYVPQLQVQLPYRLNGATFLQLYRTLQTDQTSPGDEMYLVAEYQLASLTFDASGLSSAIDDLLDDNGGQGNVLFGAGLYTNPSEGGLLQANDQPPLVKDLCLYNGSMVFANSTEKHSIELRLIGVDALVSGTSTIVIGGVTFRADAANDYTASPPTFLLETTGSVSGNIDATARNLCRVVNRYFYGHGGTVQAHYLSTPDTAPGRMAFTEPGVGGSSFTIHAGQDGQNCWAPDLSDDAYVLTSENNETPGKVWWSPTNQPWAANADSWEIVGAADKAVLRVIQLRQTVFVFKEDGLFTLTGNAPPFAVQPFDPTLVLLAPETCCVLNSQIYCYTNRGLVFVSESGVSPSLSWPIERDLEAIQASYPTYATAAFGVASEHDGLVFLALPTADVAECSQQYVFNANNPGWSRFTLASVRSGCFDPARQALCWSSGSALLEERRTISGLDHQDQELTGTAGATTNSATVTVTGATVVAGDLLFQGGHTFVVLSVSGSVCTIDGPYSFSAGAVTIYKGIKCQIRWLPYSDGDPTHTKRFRSMFLALRAASFEIFQVGFNSERSSTFTSVDLAGPNAAGLGGQDSEVAQFVCRADMPQKVSECAMLGVDLVIQQAQSFWQLQAARFDFDWASPFPVR